MATEAAAATDCHPRLTGEAGIWIFVTGDLAVFTLFFVLIMIGHREQASVFAASRPALDVPMGVLNTLLLVTGSWFVAIAIHRYREAAQAAARRYFTYSILCGLGFIANKGIEWSHKIDAGITPATNDFFMYFFVFTGIHLFHVILGVVALLYARGVASGAARNELALAKIESVAIFWHLVDLLWIVLFALFYLL